MQIDKCVLQDCICTLTSNVHWSASGVCRAATWHPSRVRSSIMSTSGESGTRDHVHKVYGLLIAENGSSANQNIAASMTSYAVWSATQP